MRYCLHFGFFIALLFAVGSKTNLSAAEPETIREVQCVKGEITKDNFQFQYFFGANKSSTLIEDFADDGFLQKVLNEWFLGNPIDDFIKFFKQVVEQQGTRDEMEIRIRDKYVRLAWQKMRERFRDDRLKGEGVEELIPQLERLLHKEAAPRRSFSKHTGGLYVFYFGHQPPECFLEWAIKDNEAATHFVIYGMMSGPWLWSVHIKTSHWGKIESIVVHSPIGPFL